MISAELNIAVSEFRAVMGDFHTELGDYFQDFPRGCCVDCTQLLAAYLKDVGLGKFAYFSGRRDGYSHAWLELGDVIVDFTSDQFSVGPSGITVTSDRSWHEKFGIHPDRFEDGDFRVWQRTGENRLSNA